MKRLPLKSAFRPEELHRNLYLALRIRLEQFIAEGEKDGSFDGELANRMFHELSSCRNIKDMILMLRDDWGMEPESTLHLLLSSIFGENTYYDQIK